MSMFDLVSLSVLAGLSTRRLLHCIWRAPAPSSLLFGLLPWVAWWDPRLRRGLREMDDETGDFHDFMAEYRRKRNPRETEIYRSLP